MLEHHHFVSSYFTRKKFINTKASNCSSFSWTFDTESELLLSLIFTFIIVIRMLQVDYVETTAIIP